VTKVVTSGILSVKRGDIGKPTGAKITSNRSRGNRKMVKKSGKNEAVTARIIGRAE
jgi:hypothetical protein